MVGSVLARTSVRRVRCHRLSMDFGGWCGSREYRSSLWLRISSNVVAWVSLIAFVYFVDRCSRNFLCFARLQKKCDMYWPKKGSETYGCIQVTLLREDVMATYTIRTLQIRHMKVGIHNFYWELIDSHDDFIISILLTIRWRKGRMELTWENV